MECYINFVEYKNGPVRPEVDSPPRPAIEMCKETNEYLTVNNWQNSHYSLTAVSRRSQDGEKFAAVLLAGKVLGCDVITVSGDEQADDVTVQFRQRTTAAVRAAGRRRPPGRHHAPPRQEKVRRCRRLRRRSRRRDVITLCVDARRHRFRRLRQQHVDGVVDGGRCGGRRVFVGRTTSRSRPLRQHRFGLRFLSFMCGWKC